MRARDGLAWAVVVFVLAATFVVRLGLLDVPLDRDEGEYAYIGRLLLDGVPPYATAYNMKMPGIYAAYALVLAAFGETSRAVHLGLAVVNGLGILLVFLLGRRLAGAAVAAVAAAHFAALTLTSSLLGVTAYAEHFMLPPVLAGMLVLHRALDAPRARLFLAAGVLLGLAPIVKQSGAAFVLLGLAWAALAVRATDRRTRLASLAALATGSAVPLVLVSGVLAIAGAFSNFWFWTVQYAFAYATRVPLAFGVRHFLRMAYTVAAPAWPIYAAAALGLALVMLRRVPGAPPGFVLVWLACSFLAVVPGLYFRQQYFILLAPAVAFLAAVTPFGVARLVPRARWRVLAALVLSVSPPAYAIASDRELLFATPPTDVSRTLYQPNPFAESREVAAQIRARTTPDDTVAVLGSEPQIYFYAGRRAATGYIYMYPLMEAQPYATAMQEQMIRELEASRPKFLVFVNVDTSWLIGDGSERRLSQWLSTQWSAFERVGLVELHPRAPARHYWDEAARGREPASTLWLGIYRRRAR